MVFLQQRTSLLSEENVECHNCKICGRLEKIRTVFLIAGFSSVFAFAILGIGFGLMKIRKLVFSAILHS